MRLPSRPFANQGGVVVLAHRGFSGLYPENTILAFEKAAELPIDGLEMDIHATRDGVLVISHDDSVERMTNGEGKIQDFTFDELNQLDAGYRFTPDGGQTYPFRGQGLTIPTMEEVLQHFTDLWINVDIKAHEKEVVEKFCQLISKYDAHERMCVGSSSTKIVKYFRKICPQVVSIATLVEIATLLFLSKFHLERFYKERYLVQAPPQESRWGISLDIVTRRFVEAAHKRQTAVHIWTVNEQAEMSRYINWGMDGIITDYPDRALKLLDRLPESKG
jgi:glycerophosphoryl diester phosphodiesterase